MSEEKKDLTIKALKRYLPERVVEKILTNPEETRVEGERKIATILFGDISGFTALLERLDPEEVVRVINDYFKKMLKIVDKYGGDVDKFLGDAIMVIFGAPVAHEDDPERAVRAALEMQEMIKTMDKVVAKGEEIPIRMSIGINTGEIVALNIGSDERMEYIVMGDNVNLTSRLEGVANAGEVIVSHSTYEKVKGIFDFKKLPFVKVKGKRKPIRIYLTKGVKELRERLKLGSAPIVNRREELEIITQCITELMQKKGGVVAITGEAGIGKSRLAKELEVKANVEGMNFLKGKCVSYGKSLTYLPFVNLFKTYFELSSKETEKSAIKKIKNKIKSLDPNLETISPFIGMLLSIDFGEESVASLDPEKKKKRTFEAVKNLIVAESRKNPTLVEIEDFQWADETSVELLNFILKSTSDDSILFCLDYRSDFDFEIPTEDSITIKLKKLSQTDTSFLASSLLNVASIPEDMKKLVLEKTEGNPLFIEELTRTLVDKKLIKSRDGEAIITKGFKKARIPASIMGVALGRIDSLPEVSKKTLRYASVVGRSFTPKLLTHTFGFDPRELGKILRGLVQNNFLYPNVVSGEKTYEFHSQVTHQVAYDTLLKGRRRELHEKVGGSIERLYTKRLGEYYELLAHHYSQSDNLEKAYEYLQKAGDKTKSLFVNRDAIEFYNKGLSILKRLEPTGERLKTKFHIFTNQGFIFDLIGKREDALKNHRNSLQIANRLKDRDSMIRSLSNIGIIFDKIGNHQRSSNYFKRAQKEAKKIGNDELLAKSLNNLGTLYLHSGNSEKALKYFQKSLELNKSIKDKREIANQYSNIGGIYDHRGEFDRALKHYKLSLQIREEIKDLIGTAISLSNIGVIYSVMGRFEEASNNYSKSLEISRKIGDREMESLALMNIGLVSMKQGNYDNAIKLFEDSLAIRKDIGDKHGSAEVLTNIAEISQGKGEYKSALKFHQKALAGAQETGDIFLEVYTRINTGVDYLYLGRYMEALKNLEDGLETTKKITNRQFEADAMHHLSEVYRLLGSFTLAENLMGESLAIAKEMGNMELVGKVLNSRAQLLCDMERYSEAAKDAEQVLSIADKIGSVQLKVFALNSFALISIGKGDGEKISEYSRKASELANNLGDRRLLASIYLDSADYYLLLGDNTSSIDTVKEAMSIAEEIDGPELLWRSHRIKGENFEKMRSFDLADEEYKKAVGIIESIRKTIPEDLKTGFLSANHRLAPYRNLLFLYIKEKKNREAITFLQKHPLKELKDLLREYKTEDKEERKLVGQLLMLTTEKE